MADPTAWPTLEEIKVNETTQTVPKEKKKDSPREEQKELQQQNSSESKKKCNAKFRNRFSPILAANWVPLPIEVQTR